MPYVKQDIRELLDIGHPPGDAGELNYLITNLCLFYIDNKDIKYQYINDVLGALEGAKLEFYRRLVAPYEDKKAVENGDVYE